MTVIKNHGVCDAQKKKIYMPNISNIFNCLTLFIRYKNNTDQKKNI